MLRVIEGGRQRKDREANYLSGDDIVEIWTAMSTPQRRALLARVRAHWPMHHRSPDMHAFMLSFAKWIEAHGDKD